MGIKVASLAAAVLASALVPPLPSRGSETIFDRRVHVEPGRARLFSFPPLCDSLDLERRRIDVGGCELHCEVEGAGVPLVLINGGPGGTHHDLHPHFSRAAAFAQVVYYDQRGCGQSGWVPAGGYTIDQAVADLDGLRKGLGFDRWVVLGWSYGGVLAQCYAVEHPERVAGLVLVGSAPVAQQLELGPSRAHDYLSPRELARMAELRDEPGIPRAQRLYDLLVNGDWKRQHFARPSRAAMARTALHGWCPAPAFRESIQATLYRVDLRGAFAASPLPTMLMDGVWDLTWSADKSEQLHACFPGSRLVRFPRSSHAPFEDEPRAFFHELRDFVVHLVPPDTAAIDRWRARLRALKAARDTDPEHVLLSCGWGRAASARVRAACSRDWLDRLERPELLLKLGCSLYDGRQYEAALEAFTKLARDPSARGLGLVWKGHMLDLLGRREEAKASYRRASRSSFAGGHEQYGLYVDPSYAARRVTTPFTRLENLDTD